MRFAPILLQEKNKNRRKIPPALKYTLSIYIFQELFPRIFVGHEVKRALFPGYVIVTNDIVAVQITDFTQPSGQFYEGLIACVGELT